MEINRSDIVWHDQSVTREDRESRLGQKSAVIWFTGLSGCGKSTVANELDRQLGSLGCVTMLLDGDNLRHGLCAPAKCVGRGTWGGICKAIRIGV